jgi:hypothetical protein
MDDTSTRTILAFPAEYLDTDGEKFFDTLIDCCRDGGGPATVDDLVPAITARDAGLGRQAEAYRDNLRAEGLESAWADATKAMVEEGSGDRLVTAYRDRTPAAPTWAGFVAAHQRFWATWDGTRWDEWRNAFLQTGNQYGVATDTETQLAWLDNLTNTERATYLRDRLGFAVGEFRATAEIVPDWAGFVATHQQFWATWDGTRWDEWRNAFLQTGNQYGVATDTETQLAWLDNLTNTERATYLRDQLGFAVGADAFQATPVPAEQIEAAAARTIDTIMDEVTAQLPALAAELGISVEELQAELSRLPADQIIGAIQEGLPR